MIYTDGYDSPLGEMTIASDGGAVGNNPILLMIPCHRVIGANGSLTGYGGGMQRKIKLLEMEGVNSEELGVRNEELRCRRGDGF